MAELRPTRRFRPSDMRAGRTKFDVRGALYTLLGADLSQIHGLGPYTVLRLVAECGDDMRKWPTAKHFTSWLTLAPGNKISGGRVLSSKSRRSSNRAAAPSYRCGERWANADRPWCILPSGGRTSRQGEGSDRDGEKVSSAVLQRCSLRTHLCRPWRRLLRETLSREGLPQPPASRSSVGLHVGRGGCTESVHWSFLGKRRRTSQA